MLSLTHQFLAWCRSKPATEEYDFCDARNCAFAQFAGEIGLSWSPVEDPPSALLDALFATPEECVKNGIGKSTFGALADRVERQLAEQVTL